MNDIDIVKKVSLLALFKKEPEESIKDIQLMLVDTGMFEMKECKQVFKELKAEQYIINDQLSLKGITVAQTAELEFKQ